MKHIHIRAAHECDRQEIITLYQKSQTVTGNPDPEYYPPDKLGDYLFQRLAVRRLVAERAGRILGHGLVELPNTEHISKWVTGSNLRGEHLLELGGAFVDPDHFGEGIWSGLLTERLRYVDKIGKTAVTATWVQNEHVIESIRQRGAVHIGNTDVSGGVVALYRFDH